MGKMIVCKIFTFEAAHNLPNYDGPCCNQHGHSYKLEVSVSGPIQDTGSEKGMIVDFSKLKAYIQKNIIDVYDHTNLNESFDDNPTAEKLLYKIVDTIGAMNGLITKLERVRLWETATSYAQWTAY